MATTARTSLTSLPGVSSEVKLYTNNKERELYENLADVYAIVKALEHLEKAYVRDSVSAKDYTPACTKLIAQYKTAQNVVKDWDLAKFMQEYKLDCPAAVERLKKAHVYIPKPKPGYPATTEHSDVIPAPPGGIAKSVAETVQHFITAMDSIKLNLISVDALHPLVSDIVDSLNKNMNLPPDFDGKVKLRNWLTILNQMKASDELNEEQVRQLLFDLESSYNSYHKTLATFNG